MTNDDITLQVGEIQKWAAIDTKLTIQQMRHYLARVVRAKVPEIGDDSGLWQVTNTEDGVKRKLAGSLSHLDVFAHQFEIRWLRVFMKPIARSR